MRAFLLLAAIAAIAFAGVDVKLNFDAKANLTNAEADFAVRINNVAAIAFNVQKYVPIIPISVNVLAWSSANVTASANETAKASATVMVGLGVLPSTLNLPFAILAYGSGAAAVGVNPGDFLTDLIGGKVGAAFNGGLLAMSAISIQELTAENKEVDGKKPVLFTADKCDASKINTETDDVFGYACSFTKLDAQVTVTYITAKKAGILEYGRTPVSPRSLEMVIEVKNYKYADEKNHLRMLFGLLTASGAGSVEGEANFVHREGKEDLYAAVSKYAVVSGKRKEVKVEIQSSGLDEGTLDQYLLKIALGAKFDARVAHIDFPAGATDIVYDPAVGSGKDIYQAGASAVALSFLVALISVLVLLF